MKRLGTMYLLHFDPPLGHAQHYFGWTLAANIDPVLCRAAIVRAARTAGCRLTIVRRWAGVPQQDAKQMRMAGNGSRRCPLCRRARRTAAAAATSALPPTRPA